VLGGAGRGRIDPAQRVGDNGPAQRRGAPAPVGRDRERHRARFAVVHHQIIMSDRGGLDHCRRPSHGSFGIKDLF
jgi:hypothetical protein